VSESDNITIIGRGAHIKGDIAFDTPARILGTVEGTIHAKTEMYIAETANCKATVHGTSILVDGTVEGALIATDRVELSARCCVKGDITAAALVVADGASFIGHCRVGPEAVSRHHLEQAPAMAQPIAAPAHTTPRVPAEPPALQIAAEKPAPRAIPDRIIIPDKGGVEVKAPAATQSRPRARTADWMPPATPAFPTVVTKATEWNGSPANS